MKDAVIKPSSKHQKKIEEAKAAEEAAKSAFHENDEAEKKKETKEKTVGLYVVISEATHTKLKMYCTIHHIKSNTK